MLPLVGRAASIDHETHAHLLVVSFSHDSRWSTYGFMFLCTTKKHNTRSNEANLEPRYHSRCTMLWSVPSQKFRVQTRSLQAVRTRVCYPNRTGLLSGIPFFWGGKSFVLHSHPDQHSPPGPSIGSHPPRDFTLQVGY